MDASSTLKAWMESKGISNSELARLMGFSYEYIFKFSTGKIPALTDAFKWRFIQRFGWEEANRVFDAGPRPESVEKDKPS